MGISSNMVSNHDSVKKTATKTQQKFHDVICSLNVRDNFKDELNVSIEHPREV